VSPPGGADPSNTYPLLCGGSSGSGGSTTTSTTATTGTGGGGVTWTQIYNTMFGPSGTSTCGGGGCHSSSKGGFTCGTSKTSCYNGLVNSGYLTPGASASSSALVDPNSSPLCGPFAGNMPPSGSGSCITSAQLSQINSWLSSGAPNN
jgi:hypothetical protein